MNLNRARIIYSYIGNYIDLLLNNQQRIKNMLCDYEMQSKVDKLPDGKEITSLFFMQKNVVIRFTPIRIDYDFGLLTFKTDGTEAFEKACDFFKLVNDIFPDLTASRLAIVANGFIDNTNNQAIVELSNKMGFTSAFGECNEISFKINTPREGFEPLNSVLSFEQGTAKNSKTGETIKVILIAIDVNTVAASNEQRFLLGRFEEYFQDIFNEVETRVSQIEQY